MLTPHQQKIRARHVTASELPAILGADPYRGAGDVFLEKTGRVRPPEYSDAMSIGHDVEPMMIEWFCRQTGSKVTRRNLIRTNGVMSCTKDGYLVGVNEGLQIKSSGIEGGTFAVSDEWGDAGTDQVPASVLIQCAAEMAVDGTERTWVPALIAGKGRQLYVVDRDEKMVELVRSWAEWFWSHVERDVMPTGAPKIETLKRLIRTPGKIISLPDDVVSVWATARNMRLNAEKVEQEAERNLLSSLGDAEGGVSGEGNVTFFETERKNKARPASVSRYRTLRLANKELQDGGAEGQGDRAAAAGQPEPPRLADGVAAGRGQHGAVQDADGHGDEAGQERPLAEP